MGYRFGEDPRYWSSYEVVRALYKTCLDFKEDRDVVQFRYTFPNPVELQDILDGLRYYEVPFWYRRLDDLFSPYADLVVELRKSDLLPAFFGKFDFKRLSSKVTERWPKRQA